jgi:acyl-CoA synthetase (NDP forming)
LAGADELYDAFFEQLGVLRTRTFGELIDVPAALASRRQMRGPRLAILTSTGGAGVLVADACGVLGLETPPPDEPTHVRLAELLVGEGAVADRNPVDVTLAGLKSEILLEATAALLGSPTYDAVVVVVGASALANPDLAAGPIVASLERSTKPLLAYVSPYAPAIVQRLNQHGIPTFDTPEGCAAALGALHRFATPRLVAPSTALPAAPPGILAALPSGTLNEAESSRLLTAFGIETVRALVAATPAEAGRAASMLGPQVVLKVLARDLAHKSDLGGVEVGVAAEVVPQRATAMMAEVRRHRPDLQIDGWLVQEQVTGVEMIVGVRRDPQLGVAIMVGAGGINAELLADTALRLAPVDLDEARAMIGQLRSAPLLSGYRGRPPADREALARCIVALSNMAVTLGGRLLEAEINPLFVLTAGQGARAADALVVLDSERPTE